MEIYLIRPSEGTSEEALTPYSRCLVGATILANIKLSVVLLVVLH